MTGGRCSQILNLSPSIDGRLLLSCEHYTPWTTGVSFSLPAPGGEGGDLLNKKRVAVQSSFFLYQERIKWLTCVIVDVHQERWMVLLWSLRVLVSPCSSCSTILFDVFIFYVFNHCLTWLFFVFFFLLQPLCLYCTLTCRWQSRRYGGIGGCYRNLHRQWQKSQGEKNLHLMLSFCRNFLLQSHLKLDGIHIPASSGEIWWSLLYSRV